MKCFTFLMLYCLPCAYSQDTTSVLGERIWFWPFLYDMVHPVRVSIEPPLHFTLKKSVSDDIGALFHQARFHHSDDWDTQIYVMVEKSSLPQSWEGRNEGSDFSVLYKMDTILGGHKSRLIKTKYNIKPFGEENQQFYRYILIVGDATASFYCYGIFSDKYSFMDSIIKKSILTFKYEYTSVFEYTNYWIDTSIAKLQYINGSWGRRFADIDPSVRPHNYLTLEILGYRGKVSEESRDSFALAKYKEYNSTFIQYKIKEINKLKVDNLFGVEIVSTYRYGDELDYLLVLYDKEKYFTLFGEGVSSSQNKLALLKKTAKTFKRQ